VAGDWIKMRGNLWDDPRVARLCDLTDATEAAIIGGLYWLWATADQHTEDGIMPGLTLRQIDRKTGIQGFGAGLCAISWVADHPEGIRLVNFEEHNGKSAKRRCMDAQRKAGVRDLSANETDIPPTDDGQNAGLCGAREREREEEEKRTSKAQETTSPRPPADADEPPPDKFPSCPQRKIIDLYREVLPMAIQPKTWDASDAESLSARWRATFVRLKFVEEQQGLDWFRTLFEAVNASDFLSGRSQSPGKRPFRIRLQWITKRENFKKITENFYA